MHFVGTQQANLPKPVVQPHTQRRITPDYLHIHRGLPISRLMHLFKYVQLFELQSQRMPRERQLFQQITHAITRRQSPAGALQQLLGLVQGRTTLAQARHLAGLACQFERQGLLHCLLSRLNLPPLR
ncbi:hypothetical protein D3C76_919210 [compost metagenome]